MSEEEFKRLHTQNFGPDPVIIELVELLRYAKDNEIRELKRIGAIKHKDLVTAKQVLYEEGRHE